MKASQKDYYSCGLWASKILLQVVVEKRPLAGVNVSVDLVEDRNFLVRLMKTRYLYIDGVFSKPAEPSSLPQKRIVEVEEEKVGSTTMSDTQTMMNFFKENIKE